MSNFNFAFAQIWSISQLQVHSMSHKRRFVDIIGFPGASDERVPGVDLFKGGELNISMTMSTFSEMLSHRKFCVDVALLDHGVFVSHKSLFSSVFEDCPR